MKRHNRQRGRPSKQHYLSYDYERAFDIQTNMLSESQIERALKDGKIKSIYATKSSISGFEKGIRHPSEQTLKLICKEHHVYYPWLTEGKGDMFTGFPESKIDELKMEFNLSDTAASIIRNFVNMPEEKQNAIVELFEAVAKDMKKDDS